MRTIITFLIVVGNAIGAFLTYLYFSNIAQIHQAQQDLPFYYANLFFGIVTAILIFSSVGMMRRLFLPLYQIANDEVSIGNMDGATAQTLKKRAIQLPSVIAGIGFLVWILAGFIFGFLQPVITQIFYGV